MGSTRSGGGALVALSNDIANAVASAGNTVVAIHARPRIPASGVIWREGIVVAANHTIRRDDRLAATLADGRRVSATLVGRDPSTDLAVLRLDATEGVAGAQTADGLDVAAGNLILTLGRPGPDLVASLGLVSASSGEWRTWRGGRIDRFIQLGIAIRDGFSGGPLVNAAGTTVGINTSGLLRGQAVTIPGATVNRVVDQLLATGRIARGYLGIALQPVPLPEETVAELGLPEQQKEGRGARGAMLMSVERDGPGAKAGLFMGDVLIAIDDHPVRDPADLMAMLGPESVGRTLHARVYRAGTVRDVEIVVGQR